MRLKHIIMSLVLVAAVSGALVSKAGPKFTNAFGYDASSNCVSGVLDFTDCATTNTGAICTVKIGATHPQAYQTQNNSTTCSSTLQRLN